MSGKYKIVSSSNIITMVINFKDENDENKTVNVGVDYLMSKVYFFDEISKKIGYDELEKTILNHIIPDICDLPEIPEDLLIKVDEIRQGKFDNESLFNMQG
jgi:hypothetical protein